MIYGLDSMSSEAKERFQVIALLFIPKTQNLLVMI
nr:MAG TPA: hypothetical protein [Caudoviricetes sp.]